MTTLVTGAAGFIGRNLTARLVARGEPVRAMVLRGSSAPELAGAEIVEGDLRSEADVERAVTGARRIFHLGARVPHGAGRTDFWAPNVEGTVHVADAALRAGVERLVFTSSASVYGRAVSRHDLSETSPLAPDSEYGNSKVAAERALLERAKAGLPVTIARVSSALGPGATDWLVFARGIAEGRVSLVGSGSGMQSLTELGDVLDGLELCATTPGVEGETFLLAGAAPISLRGWIEAMAEVAGAPAPSSIGSDTLLKLYGAADRLTWRLVRRRLPKADRLDLFTSDRTYDISKARRLLGFSPKHDGAETARRLMRWYLDAGLIRSG